MFMKQIWDLVPSDRPKQYSSRMLIDSLATQFIDRKEIRVLDLGCGDGKSLDWFRASLPQVKWIGLDIENSPEVNTRVRNDAEFRSYNGVDIPFPDEVFDVVFSNQVFEHVRHPEKVLREIHRVLRKGGSFIGSVSYLEPFHSYSLFNFTPYGWYTVNVENGLRPTLLAGGVDSLGLIGRGLGMEKPGDNLWTCSPLNRSIIEDPALSNKEKNYKILLNAGHIVFSSMKDE